jgi:aryl-alcohol dehydrogenase-like predicted oxidoreductase
MNRGLFGKSGLKTTPMGLGLAALGRPGYINLGHRADLQADYDSAAMEARAHAVIDAAWEAGIRYFDAARSYGRAEEYLGSWLRSRSVAEATVGSKWGYTYTADWQIEADKHEVKEHSLPVLQRQIGESRERLGENLSLYQIHSATIESGVLENEAVLQGLAGLKEQALRIGLSVSGPRQPEVIRRALEVEVGGRLLFDAVQATWNLLEQSAGPALAEAHQAGLGVIIKEGLANGRLTERNDDPAFAETRSLVRDLSPANSLDQIALAAVINQPWTGTVLSGAATPEQIRSNVGAVDLAWADGLSGRLSDLAETPERYWATRSGLRWN